MLVFDVKVLHDAQQYAEQNNVKIFNADIIYHLMDYFTKYVAEVREERKLKEGKDAVFPCVLKQVATFRKNDPIVLGVDVEYGVLKIGTPITIYKKKNVNFWLMLRKTKKKSESGTLTQSSTTIKSWRKPEKRQAAWPFRWSANQRSSQARTSNKKTY